MHFPTQRVPDEFEIVGVVADVRHQDLRTPDRRLAGYLPARHASRIDPVRALRAE